MPPLEPIETFGELPESALLHVSQKISKSGTFTKGIEGPAVDSQGNLYVVNLGKPGTIGILRPGPGQAFSHWLDLPDGSIGNSIRFNAAGRMFIADFRQHRVYTAAEGHAEVEVYVADERMNQPNDMAVVADGSIYLSDPTWKKGSGQGKIWRVTPQKTLELLSDGLRTPNGIDVSPDESHLYYADSAEGKIYVYDLLAGRLENRRPFTSETFKSETLDGLRTDMAGNVYVARITMGVIDRYDSTGAAKIQIPLINREPTNLAFGGSDGRSLYVTMRDSGDVEALRVEHPGREWALRSRAGASPNP